MRRHPPLVAHELSLRAADLLREKQNEAARDLLEQITGPDEGSAVDWYLRGIAEQRLGSCAQALAAYSRALELEPGYYKCRLAICALEFRMLRWRSSWRHFLVLLRSEIPESLQGRR